MNRFGAFSVDTVTPVNMIHRVRIDFAYGNIRIREE